jgi:exosome complex component CSL4
MKSNFNQAYVEILSVGDNRLPFPAKGVIRREDIREKDVDKIVIHEHFMGGDVVKASVLSLGDSKQYYLSTADVALGVIMRTQT